LRWGCVSVALVQRMCMETDRGADLAFDLEAISKEHAITHQGRWRTSSVDPLFAYARDAVPGLPGSAQL
jgi:hypothetical protein